MKPSYTAHFDVGNSFSESGRGSRGTEVLEKKCPQLLFDVSRHYSLALSLRFLRSFALTESMAQAKFPLF